MVDMALFRHLRVAATCLAVLVALLVVLGPGGTEAKAVPTYKPAPLSQGKAKAHTPLKFKLATIGVGSREVKATLTAPRGARCTLTVSAGKRSFRLPAVKASRGKAGWGWVLVQGSKRQSVRLETRCDSSGRTSHANAQKKIGRTPGSRSELVVAGSVSILRGRPVQKPPSAPNVEPDGSKGGVENPGDPGWCTFGAWNLAQWLGTSVSGNAKHWATRAKANGLQVGTVPVVGSVFVHEAGEAGHVGVVTGVQGGQITIRDMNGGAIASTFEAAGEAKNMGQYGRDQWANYRRWMTVNFGRYASHTRPIDKYTKFIYKPNEAPNQYEGQIVQWDGDRKTQKTAWLVQQGKRYWIPTSAIYYCLKGRGVAGPTVLPAAVLDSYPDQIGQWANCSADGISIGSGTPPPETDPPPPPPPPPPAPEPTISLARGGSAPAGSWYSVSLSGWPPGSSVTLTCHDSVDPQGFWNQTFVINGAGQAGDATLCYSNDGPDHWVTGGGRESNHVGW